MEESQHRSLFGGRLGRGARLCNVMWMISVDCWYGTRVGNVVGVSWKWKVSYGFSQIRGWKHDCFLSYDYSYLVLCHIW